jgi:hypothetical protein
MFNYPVTLRLFWLWTSVSGSPTLVPVEEVYPFQVRPITRLEGMQWRAASRNDQEFGDLILQHAVLAHPTTFHGEPWDWTRIYAGLADGVQREILALSGSRSEENSALGGRVSEYA